MKFTLSWLKDHLDTDATLEQIAEKLTDIGLEVEEVENKAELFKPFTVAEVISAEQHPDADRLRVLKVKNASETVQVVCGAPNARAGMKGIFAPSGSYIPGLDVTLKPSKIRGVESNGMMVSEREMMLSDEHNGIIDLPEDTPIGTPMTELFGLDDALIEIAITPNRPDATGIYGIARDLAAAGLGTLKSLTIPVISETAETPVKVSIDDQNDCPLFVGRLVKGVKNGPSPDWLQKRLKSIGLRPISTLVDMTNFMTMAYGRPMHVYDADKLKGNIRVARGQSGDEFDALNDKSYKADETMITIRDDSGIIGLGGIVGGESTGCDENTTNVLIEAALFDPITIARTGRKLQINSDARYRFERGVDPEFVFSAMDIATRMVLDLCGGEAGNTIYAGNVPDTRESFSISINKVKDYSGLDIPVAKQVELLERVGFEVTQEGDTLTGKRPSWRPDILGGADLVEEILRLYGFNEIEAIPLPQMSYLTGDATTITRKRTMWSQRALAERGLQECVTWSFMDADFAKLFEPHAFTDEERQALTLSNPISIEMARMRPSILGNLIQAAKNNDDKGYPLSSLFEAGPVFYGINPEDQMICATGIRYGQMGERHWSSADLSRKVDVFDAKADALAVITANKGPANPQMTTDAPSYYHPGRSGVFRLGKNIIATFGEIHPKILKKLDIDAPVVGFEVMLERLPQAKNQTASRPAVDMPNLQPIRRDFAFLTDQATPADELARLAKGADKALIQDATIFDVYQGKGIEDGKKSIALTVTLQPRDATLTDEQLEELSKKVVDTIESKTNSKLRA